MNRQDEITLELAKNKADEYVVKKELDTAKTAFINDLVNKGLGNELKSVDFRMINKPVRYKKPFRVKFREFCMKISKVFGF